MRQKCVFYVFGKNSFYVLEKRYFRPKNDITKKLCYRKFYFLIIKFISLRLYKDMIDQSFLALNSCTKNRKATNFDQ